MLTVAIPKRNKLQNIIVLTPKDGGRAGFLRIGIPAQRLKNIRYS